MTAAQTRSRFPRDGIWPLVSGDEMLALDRHTIEGLGVPGEILMESAGRSLVPIVLAAARGRSGPIRVLCGSGNNGGDGFVLVRHLHAEGVAAEAWLLGDPEKLSSDAAANWARLSRIGASSRVLSGTAPAAAALRDSAVLVDALFGTGLRRPLEGLFAETVQVLRSLRGEGLPVVSVDLPSGICARTGQILGTAVEADTTLTVSLPKLGLTLEPGRQHAGRVAVARIGIADPEPGRAKAVGLWTRRAAGARLPERGPAAHKGRFGHVLVVAGSLGMLGAGALTSRAALRAGAGLVTWIHPGGAAAAARALAPPEVMTGDARATEDGGFAPEAATDLAAWAAECNVVALGPGLGGGQARRALVESCIAQLPGPLVLDADGLNALGDRPERLAGRAAATVLTPHPGEAARLLGCETAEIARDRLQATRTLAERSAATVVLKGAGTVVAAPDGRAWVVPTGGPVLSVAGTGDVLTGVVAALLAAGLGAFEAAGLAAFWHGAAGDVWAAEHGAGGLLASELADGLPRVAETLRRAAAAMDGEEEGHEVLVLRFPEP